MGGPPHTSLLDCRLARRLRGRDLRRRREPFQQLCTGATANAIAGIRAGARYVNTTVNGLGERAGNAALEEVVMALKHACGTDPGVATGRFVELSKLVGKASCRPVPEWKAAGKDLIRISWKCWNREPMNSPWTPIFRIHPSQSMKRMNGFKSGASLFS